MKTTDAHIRRRMRAILLKQWKRKRTIARKLIKLGVRPTTAWRRVYEGRKSIWALSHDPVMNIGLPNAYFAGRNLQFLVDLHRRHPLTIDAPTQQTLFLG